LPIMASSPYRAFAKSVAGCHCEPSEAISE
jgi:hypothetical protein